MSGTVSITTQEETVEQLFRRLHQSRTAVEHFIREMRELCDLAERRLEEQS